jgi:hypothetical protein
MRKKIHMLCSVLASGFLAVLITSCAWLPIFSIERNQQAGKYQKNIEDIDWDSVWFSEEIRNTPYKNQEEMPKKPVKWNEFKDFLSKKSLNGHDIRKFESKIRSNGSLIEDEQVGEAISVFNNLSDRRLRFLLFESLANNLYQRFGSEISLEFYDFFLEVAKSDDKKTSPKALSILLYSENEVGENGKDRWDDWSWSPELQALLEQAVNTDLYKLSDVTVFGDLIVLRLFDRYPDSKFTKGARLYGEISGGEPYIGAYANAPDEFIPPVLRTPIGHDELKLWASFLEDYPDHPASDNVMYRIARIHELEGNYSEALTSYYKASTMPDGALSDVARARALFIADSLMDSDSLSKLSENIEDKDLLPILDYTAAIHLIREGDINSAISKLKDFTVKYKSTTFLDFSKGYPGIIDYYIEPSSRFWENTERQVDNLELLLEIKSQANSDFKSYQEASFWFYNQLTTYNYLWRGTLSSTIRAFLPLTQNNQSILSTRLLSYDLIKRSEVTYDGQLGYLISANLLEELIENYPESKLQEKALYSLLVNYYWLYIENGAVSSDIVSQWRDRAQRYVNEDNSNSVDYIWETAVVDTANEFVSAFPTSSMADDALLTIGEVGNESESEQALRKLIVDYPKSDRIKEARKMIEESRSL